MEIEMAVEVERRAVRWLAANSPLFDPQNAPERVELLARKSLIELALFVGLRVRADACPLGESERRLLEVVERVYRRASYRELAARDPRALLLYAATHAAMRLCGREDSQFGHVLAQQAAGRYAVCFERIPYRHLDLLHTLELCAVDAPLPPMRSILPLTLLASDPSTVQLGDSDIYALTHTAFYATDFGRRPREEWAGDLPSEPAIDVLEGLLAASRGRRNADLVGELIAACACFGHIDSPELARSWRFLAAAQEEGGRVPGPPGILPPDVDELPPETRDWATSYHTTVVCALAGLLVREAASQPVPAPRHAAPRTVPSQSEIGAAIELAATRLRDAAAHSTSAEALHDQVALVHAANCGALRAGGRDDASALVAALDAVPGDGGDGRLLTLGLGGDEILVLHEASRRWELPCTAVGDLQRHLDTALANLSPEDRPGPLALVEAGLPNAAPGIAIEPQALAHEPASRGANRLARLVTVARLPLEDDPGWDDHIDRWADAAGVACREYRLQDAAALLRGLCAVGRADHRVVRDLADHLLHQLTPEGWFGYPAIDEADERQRHQRGWTRSIVVALAELWAARGGALAGATAVSRAASA